ncbi:LOW QUALITY PROTEIN: equilibrative nucleoside transporter 2-like [Rhinoraja longicauda]
MDVKQSPEDKFFFVRIIFFVLGLGTLLPWNFFITAIPYFEKHLTANASVSGNATGNVEDPWHFANWMTLLSMLPLLLFTCLNSILYPRISEKLRIAGSLFGIFILFLVTAVMVKLPMQPLNFFVTTMSVIWFINSFGAVLQGSLFGLIGLLPSKYSCVFMSGQGVAGTFAAMASIFAKICGSDEDLMALGYFITPCLVVLLTMVLYYILPQLDFAKYHFSKGRQPRAETECNAELLGHKEQMNGREEKGGIALESLEFSKDGANKSSDVVKVFSKIWIMAIAVCVVFTVTLSVFPAITAKVASHTTEGTWKEYFTPVACFLLFNVMDWFGRSFTAICMRPRRRGLVLLLAIARLAFIPLFVLCNVQGRLYQTTLFPHDAWYLGFMVAFAFSNGYLVTLCMCYAPM